MGSNRQNRPSNFVRNIITTTLLFFALGGNIFAATITFKIGEQNYEEQGNKFIVAESLPLVELVAILSEPLLNDVSFTYELFAAGTTATRFSDFQYNADDDPSQQQNRVTVTFKIGETIRPIPILISSDSIKEKDETIRFRMTMLSEAASLAQEDVYIEISDDEVVPVIVLSVEREERDPDHQIRMATDEGTGIVLTLEIITNKSDQDIKITYEITYTPAPVEGEEKDYILGNVAAGTAPELILDPENVKKGIERGVLTIPALVKELDVSLFLKRDGTPEVQENLRIELICPSDKKDENDSICPDDELAAGAVVHSPKDPTDPTKGPQTIVNVTVNDIDGNAGAINATGVTRCYDAEKEIITCNSTELPVQDGDNFDIDRFNRYVKLDSNGGKLDASEAEWACVLDENTNLVWQVKKATDTDFSVGDTSTYTWYNPIEHINGGNEGFTGGGAGIGEPDEQQTCASSICNTNAYLSRTAALTTSTCGSGNWRIPNVNELLSIINFEPDDNDSGTVVSNIDYFYHALPRFYWTSTPASVSNESAWCVYFGTTLTNHVRLCEKEEKHLVRLVKNYNPSSSEAE